MFAYFIGQGRPVEAKEGGKISMKRGHLIVIGHFYFHFFLPSVKFQNVNSLFETIENVE